MTYKQQVVDPWIYKLRPVVKKVIRYLLDIDDAKEEAQDSDQSLSAAAQMKLAKLEAESRDIITYEKYMEAINEPL